MVFSYLTGLVGILVVMLAWVGVQVAWKRSFPAGRDPDALAGRLGCHGCEKHCEPAPSGGRGSGEEES